MTQILSCTNKSEGSPYGIDFWRQGHIVITIRYIPRPVSQQDYKVKPELLSQQYSATLLWISLFSLSLSLSVYTHTHIHIYLFMNSLLGRDSQLTIW